MIFRAVVVATLLATACGDDGTPLPPPTGEVATFHAASQPDLDVLLLIDNSPTTPEQQRYLADAMPQLVNALNARPGGVPNVHIGIATSDLGTTGSLDPSHPGPSIGAGQQGGCAGAGLAGALQTYGEPVSDKFVSDVLTPPGTREKNYTGDLATLLSSMIKGAGGNGCGFEQTLSAVRAALANPDNAGFRRPAAGLAIVVLSDEDDCSVRDAAFFDPNESGPLGPLESFRCTRQGVTCAEPLDTVGAKSDCVPAAGNRYMDDVGDLAGAVSVAEPDPLRRAVVAIVGPPTPFVVVSRTPNPQSPPRPALGPSCDVTDTVGLFLGGDPAVRTAAWIAALGGTTYTICDDVPRYIDPIARQLLAVVDGDSCLHGDLYYGIPTCTVREDDTPIPACSATSGPADPCFDIVSDKRLCPDVPSHWRVAITRTTPADPDALIHVTCALAD